MNGALFRGMSHINLSHCCDAFRGLRNITITADENDANGWMTGNLAKILSGATDLERLCVHCCNGTFHISTKYILSTTAWSRLTSLCYFRSRRFPRSPKKTPWHLEGYRPLLCRPYEWFLENPSRRDEIFSFPSAYFN